MGNATAATYEWLCQEFSDDVGETWLFAGFVRNLSPENALRRIGVTPGPLGESGFGVMAYAADGGTVLIEYGWAGVVYNRDTPLSEGTAAAAVRATVNNDDFTYSVGGRLVTTFGLYSYRFREGSGPDLLQADLRALGMNLDDECPEFPDDPVSSALALAERATGVHLSRAHYAAPALIGPTDHLYPSW